MSKLANESLMWVYTIFIVPVIIIATFCLAGYFL